MLLEIKLEPAGVYAENTLLEWLETFCLSLGAGNLVEIDPDRCLELLVALRSRCYGRGLTVNVKFHGESD